MILIHLYNDLFAGDCKTLQLKKARIIDYLEKNKQYLVLINDKEYFYPKRRRFPRLKDGDIVSIRPMPENANQAFGLTGGLGGLLLSAGLLVASIGTWGAAAIALTAIGAAAFIASSVGQAVSAQKKGNKSPLDAGFGFSSVGNGINKDKPFPAIFGTCRVTPPIVGTYYTYSDMEATPYTVVKYPEHIVTVGCRRFEPMDTNTDGPIYCAEPITETVPAVTETRYLEKPRQYLNALFCLGYGDIRIKDIKLGDTIVATNEEEVLDGNVPLSSPIAEAQFEVSRGKLPALYSKRISADMVNASLERKRDGTDFVRIERKVPYGAVSVDLEISYEQGLYQYRTDKRKYDPTGQTVRAEIHADGNITPVDIAKVGFYHNKAYRFTHRVFLPSAAKDAKIIVYTADITDRDNHNTQYACLPTLISLVYNFNGEPAADPAMAEKMTFLAMRIKADANVNGILGKVNCLASSHIPVWNGRDWNTKGPSANPAAIALHMLRGGYMPRNVPDSSIDMDEFARVYEWCEAPAVPYKFNAVITEQSTLIDALNDVLAQAQAYFVLKNGKYSLAHDRRRETPLAILSPKNTRDFSARIITEDAPSAVKVTFNDELSDYEETETTVTLVDVTPGKNIISIKPLGVTSFEQANKFGRYLLASRRNRPESFSVTVPIYHLSLPVGARVRLQQFSILAGLASGRIVKVDMVENVIFLDERPANLDPEKNYGLQILTGLGEIKEFPVRPLESPEIFLSSNAFQITEGAAAEDLAGKFYAFGEFGNEAFDCVIKSKSRISTPTYAARLELVPYSEEIFDAIDKPLPEYNPSVSIPGKPVGTEVYKEPPKPSLPSDIIMNVAPDGSVELAGAALDRISDALPPFNVFFVKAFPRNNGSITVRWPPTKDAPGGSGLAGYKIYRAKNEDKSDKTIHIYGDADAVFADDTSTILGESYYYGVSAYDRNNNESNVVWTDEAALSQNVIPPESPSGLQAKAIKGSIELKWNPPLNAGNITYYEVQKRQGLDEASLWEVLGRSGTLSYSEPIGKIERKEIENWRYRVRAYNLYETYGPYDKEEGSSVDLSDYGTYIIEPVTPNLSVVTNSVNISWPAQDDLMGFKEMQIQTSRDGVTWYSLEYRGETPPAADPGGFTSTRQPFLHSNLTLDFAPAAENNNLTLDLEPAGEEGTEAKPLPFSADGEEAIPKTVGGNERKPVPTTYYYRARQVLEDGSALDWGPENTPPASAQAEPLDLLKLNVGGLSLQEGKFLAMTGGLFKGFAQDPALPENQRIQPTDAALNYWDLTNNKFRIGNLQSYFFVDVLKSAVEFRGSTLALTQSDLITNLGPVYLKHGENALLWGSQGFIDKYAEIRGEEDGALHIKATTLKLTPDIYPADNFMSLRPDNPAQEFGIIFQEETPTGETPTGGTPTGRTAPSGIATVGTAQGRTATGETPTGGTPTGGTAASGIATVGTAQGRTATGLEAGDTRANATGASWRFSISPTSENAPGFFSLRQTASDGATYEPFKCFPQSKTIRLDGNIGIGTDPVPGKSIVLDGGGLEGIVEIASDVYSQIRFTNKESTHTGILAFQGNYNFVMGSWGGTMGCHMALNQDGGVEIRTSRGVGINAAPNPLYTLTINGSMEVLGKVSGVVGADVSGRVNIPFNGSFVPPSDGYVCGFITMAIPREMTFVSVNGIQVFKALANDRNSCQQNWFFPVKSGDLVDTRNSFGRMNNDDTDVNRFYPAGR